MEISLKDHFSIIPEHRQRRKIDHELLDIIILCIVGIICGADDWQDIHFVGKAA